MVVGRRHWKFLILPLLVILLLTACERPLASNENDTADADATATAEAETAENEESVMEKPSRLTKRLNRNRPAKKPNPPILMLAAARRILRTTKPTRQMKLTGQMRLRQQKR